MDWVKSVILVTLHQQLRRDKRVRECLSGETPVQGERERENTADSVAVKEKGWLGGGTEYRL